MPIGLPTNRGPLRADGHVVQGSMRQRSAVSWELRMFAGIDPDTGRRRYRSRTLRRAGPMRNRELAAMVAAVRAVRDVGVRSPLGDLLEA